MPRPLLKVPLRKPKETPPVIEASSEELLKNLKQNVETTKKESGIAPTPTDAPPGTALTTTGVPDDGSPMRKLSFHALYQKLVLFLSGSYQPDLQDNIFKKLQNASLRDIVYCLTEIAEQLRLEEGKANEITEVNHRVAIILDYARHKDFKGTAIEGTTGPSTITIDENVG